MKFEQNKILINQAILHKTIIKTKKYMILHNLFGVYKTFFGGWCSVWDMFLGYSKILAMAQHVVTVLEQSVPLTKNAQ